MNTGDAPLARELLTAYWIGSESQTPEAAQVYDRCIERAADEPLVVIETLAHIALVSITLSAKLGEVETADAFAEIFKSIDHDRNQK
jgi:hypothetical protein